MPNPTTLFLKNLYVWMSQHAESNKQFLLLQKVGIVSLRTNQAYFLLQHLHHIKEHPCCDSQKAMLDPISL